MRFSSTPEEERLLELTKPYMRVFFNPFRTGIDPNAPKEIKDAYYKLGELTAEHIKSCQEP